MRYIADVEYANAPEPLRAHAVLHPLSSAVQPGREVLARDEQQILVGGDVTLGGGTDVSVGETGLARVADIPDLPPVVIALYCVVTVEGQVRVGHIHELVRGRGLGDHAQIPYCLSGVHLPGP